MYYSTTYMSPVGVLTLACEGDSLVGLWMEGQKYFGETISGEMVDNPDMPVFTKTKTWLDRYFAGKKPEIAELSLAPIGGDFRQAVWKILCEIPYGEVITYGDIAKRIAQKMNKKRMSSQAVGGAVGHNPISIIIPCHRVVGSNGSVTGYSGGVAKKIALLEHEGFTTAKLVIPKKGIAL